ncbi:hypothetical protein [uncultured Methanobrevibacter sp.]|uniref:hypothetical protein n=1 Tax=uncultured Methanobrevibacter sp. TaxID=253161 RepID=UPI0025857532|nr:hypothetical protein [uncultured Methanobrevibacter sp.]
MNDTTLKKIKKTISKVNPALDETIYKAIISQCYLDGKDIADVERLIIGLYEGNENPNYSASELSKYMDRLYNGEEEPNAGIRGIRTILIKKHNKKISNDVVNSLTKLLTNPEVSLSLELTKTNSLHLDNIHNEVIILKFAVSSKGDDNSDYIKVLSCYPNRIIIHDNPISDAGRTFSIYWITKNGASFKTESMLIPEIEQYLINHGYVLSPRDLKGTIAGIIQISIDKNIAEIKNEIETPGFYWNSETEQLDIIDFEYTAPTTDNLKKSLILIEGLSDFFKGNETKLATILKWNLIAPFAFAKKQLGQPLENLVPHLYLYGKSGSGKTTASRIGIYFWSTPTSKENDIGGSEADTIPRLGAQISTSTFSKIINEPSGIFNKKSLTEMMKTAVERTNARRKFEGNNFNVILALNPIQYTSNFSLPNVEGLSRRFLQLLFTHSEKKEDDEKQAFMKKYRMDQPTECLFHDLKFLADFTLEYIVKHPEVLKLNWQDLANKMIMQAYIHTGRHVPDWLLSFEEAVSDIDIDDEETEDLRMFFLDVINKQINNIVSDVYDSPNGKNSKRVKTESDFKDRVFDVLNEARIPYMGIHYNTRNEEYYVYSTTGLKKALHNANHACYDIKSVAELLDWKYKPIKVNGKTKRVMLVRFNKFMEFLYPKYEVVD